MIILNIVGIFASIENLFTPSTPTLPPRYKNAFPENLKDDVAEFNRKLRRTAQWYTYLSPLDRDYPTMSKIYTQEYILEKFKRIFEAGANEKQWQVSKEAMLFHAQHGWIIDQVTDGLTELIKKGADEKLLASYVGEVESSRSIYARNPINDITTDFAKQIAQEKKS